METITKARAIGGSLVVTIPKEIVEKNSIREGELVRINVEKVKRSGFGLFKGIGSFTAKDELDTEI